jgi:hypothetical protein
VFLFSIENEIPKNESRMYALLCVYLALSLCAVLGTAGQIEQLLLVAAIIANVVS